MPHGLMRRARLKRENRIDRPPATHQDEFPAEYSLAGCSSAEPAAASSAMPILNRKPSVRQKIFSERQLSPWDRVSFPHAGHPFGPEIHVQEESAITLDQYHATIDDERSAYLQTFGQDAFKQATGCQQVAGCGYNDAALPANLKKPQ